MDASFFSSQFQMVMYQLIFTLLNEQLNTSASATTTEAEAADVSASNASGKSGFISGKFAEIIQAAAAKYDVDADLISAVIKAESNFNANAVSSCGALGLMQLMPATAESLGVEDPLDPKQNIFGGTKFLHRLLDKYNNNISLALAAYNAGPGAVDKYGGIPPYSETQTYVKRVLNYLA